MAARRLSRFTRHAVPLPAGCPRGQEAMAHREVGIAASTGGHGFFMASVTRHIVICGGDPAPTLEKATSTFTSSPIFGSYACMRGRPLTPSAVISALISSVLACAGQGHASRACRG